MENQWKINGHHGRSVGKEGKINGHQLEMKCCSFCIVSKIRHA